MAVGRRRQQVVQLGVAVLGPEPFHAAPSAQVHGSRARTSAGERTSDKDQAGLKVLYLQKTVATLTGYLRGCAMIADPDNVDS